MTELKNLNEKERREIQMERGTTAAKGGSNFQQPRPSVDSSVLTDKAGPKMKRRDPNARYTVPTVGPEMPQANITVQSRHSLSSRPEK